VTHVPAAAPGPQGRFPGFAVLRQAPRWDGVTALAIRSRVAPPATPRFFTAAEQATARALVGQLLDQPHDGLGVPVMEMIDARLAGGQTDGWRYEDMPEDGQAWRDTLANLDTDAKERFGAGFAACARREQAAIVQAVQDLGSRDWHGLLAGQVWSLWTRYACTALYAHPAAWDEIGFPGPAYPRGYKNIGVDAREPFEVRDTRPAQDPVRERL
jgi:gluconate 2-dehydrogenase subunit 3-like protein